MKNQNIIVITLYAAMALLVTAPVLAEQGKSPIPFGGYQKNGKCGFYGAKSAIKTTDEARKVIEGFLTDSNLRIGTMEERPRFFRAELVDGNGAVKDVVIVHKVNGRVRSTY